MMPVNRQIRLEFTVLSDLIIPPGTRKVAINETRMDTLLVRRLILYSRVPISTTCIATNGNVYFVLPLAAKFQCVDLYPNTVQICALLLSLNY